MYLVNDLENFTIHRAEKLNISDTVMHICFGEKIWIINTDYHLESLDSNFVGLNYYPEIDQMGKLRGCYLDFDNRLWLWSDTSLATYNTGWSFFTLPSIAPYKFIITSDGTLWSVTQEGQVFVKPKTQENWIEAASIPSKPVYHI
ncbi:MAG: hypothetical protein Fur0022_38580 [Anaerolineales bacterium]